MCLLIVVVGYVTVTRIAVDILPSFRTPAVLDGAPVSIFVLPRESLSAFTAESRGLSRREFYRDREGSRETVLSIIDRNLVVVTGEVEPAKFMRVPKSYDTYPHHSELRF